MKNAVRSLPAKITAFMLCILMLVITAASIAGAFALAEVGVYTHSKESILGNSIYGEVYNDAYDLMYYVVDQENPGHYVEHEYSVEQTNLRYQILSPAGDVVHTNVAQDNDQWKYDLYYLCGTDEDGFPYFDCYGEYPPEGEEAFYTVRLYLDQSFPITDKYAAIVTFVNLGYQLRYWIYVIGVVAFLFSAVCFVLLLCVSGRKPNVEELCPGALHPVPIDLLLAGLFLAFGIGIELTVNIFNFNEPILDLIIVLFMIAAVNVALGLCMSIATRIKDHSLLKNTVIWMVCKVVWKAIKWVGRTLKTILRGINRFFLQIPLIWRTVVIVCGISFAELIVIMACWWETDILLIWWILEKIVLVPLIFYAALVLRKLQKGGIAIAAGDLNYKVDTKSLLWDFKRHGENLNSISDGMQKAVEERLQSERMKTELITNVSHDIKTPLTSIISYADLIGRESCETEHHQEYAEVLVRKSEHLKRLLDDLVEVSKATTGNLEVNLTACDAGVLLAQVAGEFAQRCETAGLELITNQTEENIHIMADSRRIWRVFENLMQNACKYSLPGSRVYLSLEQKGQQAIFTFRNTSRAALNISPEELMERFVRGDTSRSTEGNGLGLSIARSLTELQNGNMEITIDGDLFKVTLTFPRIA